MRYLIFDYKRIPLNALNSFGDNALLSAAFAGKNSMVRYLLRKTLYQWDSTDSEKNGVLHIAAANDNLPLVRYIIKHGPPEVVLSKSWLSRPREADPSSQSG